MKKSLIALVFILFAGSFVDASGQTTMEKIEVAHYRQFCEGVVPKKCLVIRRERRDKFEAIWDEIENFDFIPGFTYILEVEIEKVAAPPKDTSGFIYRLKKIVSRTEASAPEMDMDLYGTKWRLVRIHGEQTNKASGAWLAFDAAKGRIFGYGGCNSFNGGFVLEDQILKASDVIATTSACLVDWGVETGFLRALAQGGELTVDEGSFVVQSGGKELLAFVPYE